MLQDIAIDSVAGFAPAVYEGLKGAGFKTAQQVALIPPGVFDFTTIKGIGQATADKLVKACQDAVADAEAPPAAPTTTFPSDQIGRLRILIDIARVAEKDYLAHGTSRINRCSAKRLLFGEKWFRDVCFRLGVDCDIARLHLVLWKSRGRVGDPIFGFLGRPDSYDRFVRGESLPVPDLDRLKREILDNGNRRIKPRTRRASPQRN